MNSLSAVILAGGQGQRMGGLDKGLVPFRDRPMIEHSVELVRPYVQALLISCNRNEPRYMALADKTVVDASDEYLGPLAGILAGLTACDADQLLVLPCDTPLLSKVVLDRLLDTAREYPDHICILAEGDKFHPLHAVIPVSLQADLQRFMEGKQRAVQRWMRAHPYKLVDISDLADELYNLNTPEELFLRE
ncbi:MAG: molybdenum cofactor guanylyltransferase MobA [Amphritea sp.]